MKILAIVNPMSGAGLSTPVAGRRVAMIRDELQRRGLDGSIHLTERPGHARELASSAADAAVNLVIVWGGDGTVNEVGGGLEGSATALGLIPAGSGNGLAGALRIPRAPEAALASALDGRTIAVDVGRAGNRPFFNVAGIGFDAHIARLFNERERGRRGRLPYILIGVREGCRYSGLQYKVTLDGETSADLERALLIAFANGSEYGMGMQIAPGAKLDDGLLEACVVGDRAVWKRFRDARHLALGSVQRAPGIVYRPVRTASIEVDGEIEYHVDGECGLAEGRLDVAVNAGALRVRVPRESVST